jgi:hypothetical protein
MGLPCNVYAAPTELGLFRYNNYKHAAPTALENSFAKPAKIREHGLAGHHSAQRAFIVASRGVKQYNNKQPRRKVPYADTRR